MWYSFDHGMAHFISLDSETDLGNGIVGPDEVNPLNSGPFGAYKNAQVDWLEKDLAGIDRTRTPWVIVSKFSMQNCIQPQANKLTVHDPSASSRLVCRLSRRLYRMPASF